MSIEYKKEIIFKRGNSEKFYLILLNWFYDLVISSCKYFY